MLALPHVAYFVLTLLRLESRSSSETSDSVVSSAFSALTPDEIVSFRMCLGISDLRTEWIRLKHLSCAVLAG